jgi:hypothetical protein
VVWGNCITLRQASNCCQWAEKAEIWTRTGIDTNSSMGMELARSLVISLSKTHPDTVQTPITPRVLGAGNRRTLSFSVCDLFCREIREIRTVELSSNRGCLCAGEYPESAYCFPSLAESNPHAGQAQNTTRHRMLSKFRNLCNHFATKLPSWDHGARIEIRTVLVNAPRIARVTCRSPLID